MPSGVLKNNGRFAQLHKERTFTYDGKTTTTSGYAMVVHGCPKTPKNTSFLGSFSPEGSHSSYILGDTTRPGHVTCVLV